VQEGGGVFRERRKGSILRELRIRGPLSQKKKLRDVSFRSSQIAKERGGRERSRDGGRFGSMEKIPLWK